MKRYKNDDKKINDKIYDSNLDDMEKSDMEDIPFQKIIDHILNMARCVEDIADIHGLDPSIALAFMSTISLHILNERHSPEVFKTLWTNTLDQTGISAGNLMKALLNMMLEEGCEDIQVVRYGEMPPKLKEVLDSNSRKNVFDLLAKKKNKKSKPH